MSEDNKLEKPSNIADMFKPKLYGMAAKKEAARKAIADINPQDCPTKLAIIFDDSGSMGGQPIKDAYAGVRNFSTQCNPKDTAIAVYPLNRAEQGLTVNFDLLNLYVSSTPATGGTKLYTVTQRALRSTDDYSRLILFSDGEPTDNNQGYGEEYQTDNHEATIKLACEQKIPLDTIYIGMDTAGGYKIMKDLADRTGGIFIHFKDASSLASGLKYLSPALRGLLANPEIKAKIERGETI